MNPPFDKAAADARFAWKRHLAEFHGRAYSPAASEADGARLLGYEEEARCLELVRQRFVMVEASE